MTIEQYEKLLDALEKNVVMHGCAINDILYDYDEKKCHTCERDCFKCEEASLEQIKKLKEEVKSASNWVSVKERLPKHLVPVLTCDAYGNMHIMRHYVGSEYPFGIDPYHHRFYEVVTWQPLPQPYVKEKTDD